MGVGFWKGTGELGQARRGEKIFEPSMAGQERTALYNGWKEAVSRVRSKRD
jgi:glycerol kinase